MDAKLWSRRAIVAVIAATALVSVSLALRCFVNRPPFLLVITPGDNGGNVQFIQPLGLDDKMMVSELFHVDETIMEPFQIALTSRECKIPHAVIELGDTTILPGAFRIRFGARTFDVISTRITVDGQEHEWLDRPPPQTIRGS